MTATEQGPVPDGAARPGLAAPTDGPAGPGTAPPGGPVTAPGTSPPPDDGAHPRADAIGAVGPGDAPVRARAMRAGSVISEAWRNIATGTTRAALTWQVLLETAAWTGVAGIVAVPALWWLAADAGLPADHVSTWVLGMRTVLAGAGAVLVGATVGALSTREKHLFKYFKER